jgi:hypothetical protein
MITPLRGTMRSNSTVTPGTDAKIEPRGNSSGGIVNVASAAIVKQSARVEKDLCTDARLSLRGLFANNSTLLLVVTTGS